MTTIPDATLSNFTHPVTLEEQDGSNKIGLNLCGPNTEDDILGITRSPFPRTGLKISQSETQYSDEELPYVTSHQDDFSGGRGAEKFESDKTRLADAFRANTMFPELIFPGGQERFTTGQGQVSTEYWTPSGRVHGTTTFTDAILVAKKFTTPALVAAACLEFQMEWFATPAGNIQVDIYTHDAGNNQPNALQENLGTILAASVHHGVHTYVVEKTISLANATTYWIVFTMTATDTGTLIINTADTTTQATKRYSGGSWSLVSGEMYFRWFHHWYTRPADSHLFIYKGALYSTIFDKLYINGDRGVADVSSAGHDLEDASKTGWTADEWNGCVLYIYRGTGAGNYFTIEDSDQGWLDLVNLSSWISFDTTTEYVILGSTEWQQVWDIGSNYFPTDVVVAGEFVYFSFNSLVQIKRYNCYNASGTFTERNATEGVYADKLAVTYNSNEKRHYLWGSYDDNTYTGFGVWKMSVPKLWAALYRDRGELSNFESPWDAFADASLTIAKSATESDAMTISIPAGFTTGLLASKDLSAPINITKGSAIGLAIKSSVATSAGDIKLILAEDRFRGASATAAAGVTRTVDQLWSEATGTGTLTEWASAKDGDSATSETKTVSTTTEIYVGCVNRFDIIYVNIGGTPNTNAATLALKYMNTSGQFSSATLLSDGTLDTATSTKTFNKSGAISFTCPDDWELFDVHGKGSLFWIKITVSANLTANVTFNLFRSWLTVPTQLSIPALTANVWTWINLTGSFLKRPYPDQTVVSSLGLFLYTDLGAQTITLRDSVRVVDALPEWVGTFTSRIASITPYGATISNPHVLLEEGSLLEIQIQNDDAVVPVPLEELKALASPVLGKYTTTSDVYLYFSAGERLERYHEGQMDNIGPDVDNGLPSDRAGEIHSVISAPGGIIFESLDGNDVRSILMRKSGWHEIYRSPIWTGASSGLRISAMLFQSIPGQLNRLWFVRGRDTCFIEIPLSKSDDSADYVLGSSVIVPWISAGFLDVQKRLMTLKLYTESLSAANKLRVFYQLESGDEDDPADWTELASTYTTSPFETNTISSTYGVAARRGRLKLMFYNTQPTARPKLLSWILGAILALDVRYMYTLRVRLSDNPRDLRGKMDYNTKAETLQARLDTWLASPPTVLTMKTIFSTMGGSTGKKVIVQPYPFKPYSYIQGPNNEEVLVADIQLLEVV